MVAKVVISKEYAKPCRRFCGGDNKDMGFFKLDHQDGNIMYNFTYRGNLRQSVVEPERICGGACDIRPLHLRENWVDPPQKNGKPNFSRGPTVFHKRVDRFLKSEKFSV